MERARRILLVCLVASAALHVLVLVFLSGHEIDRSAPSVQVLEVRLLAPEPLAAAPVTPAPSATGRPRSAQRADAVVANRPQAPSTPVSAAKLGGDHATTQIGADLPAPVADVPLADNGARPDPAPAVSAPGREALPASKAAYLHNPAPAYPPIARRNGEQGTVTLRVLVARDGATARVSVERSSGSAQLDRSALEAVREWRFVPAREQGESVEVWMLVPIAFRLQGAS